MKRLTLAALIGLALGYIGAKILFVNSGKSLFIWAAAGLIIGGLSRTYRQAMAAGAVYGFVLSFFFMAFSYTGAAGLLSRVPFFALLGAFGALCGLVLALLGALIAKLFTRKSKAKEDQ